jgi:hypothetical protein
MCWFILSVRIIEMNSWVELIDMLIYFTGNDYQKWIIGLNEFICWFILLVRITKMNYWIELIDMLIHFTDKDYGNKLFNIYWCVDLFHR